MKQKECYQDYVIKDGIFIGKFEEMYQKFDDPWHQNDTMEDLYSKLITPISIKKYNVKNILEVGCGLGHFTHYIKEQVPTSSITGIDISKTAIERAKKNYPEIHFEVNDLLSLSQTKNKYDCIIFAEIMWYILDDIDLIIQNLSQNYKNVIIMINQVFYYEGEQKYGTKYFTSLDEMINYLPWKCLTKISINQEGILCNHTHSIFRI